MRRREFMTLLGVSAAGWPLAARAQQATMPVIGFLHSGSPEQVTRQLGAFRRGLAELDYVEGHNFAFEYRWAEGQSDRLLPLAADLAARRVAVLVAPGAASYAGKAATTTVPVLFLTARDPVAVGLVASLNRPGGNLTGVTSLNVDLAPKRLEFLHELMPKATRAALLVDPATPQAAEQSINDAQAAARVLGLELHVLRASTESELEAAFANFAELRAGGLVVSSEDFFNLRYQRIAELALRHAVPTVFQYPEFAAAGGLMSYGSSNTDAYRLVGNYAGRILKGEKPADLPVQQATRIELIINVKTAKALGLEFPINISGRADQVVE